MAALPTAVRGMGTVTARLVTAEYAGEGGNRCRWESAGCGADGFQGALAAGGPAVLFITWDRRERALAL